MWSKEHSICVSRFFLAVVADTAAGRFAANLDLKVHAVRVPNVALDP